MRQPSGQLKRAAPFTSSQEAVLFCSTTQRRTPASVWHNSSLQSRIEVVSFRMALNRVAAYEGDSVERIRQQQQQSNRKRDVCRSRSSNFALLCEKVRHTFFIEVFLSSSDKNGAAPHEKSKQQIEKSTSKLNSPGDSVACLLISELGFDCLPVGRSVGLSVRRSLSVRPSHRHRSVHRSVCPIV